MEEKHHEHNRDDEDAVGLHLLDAKESCELHILEDDEDFKGFIEARSEGLRIVPRKYRSIEGVGDGRNGDDSDDGVPGVNGKWSHRGIEYSSAGRKNTFS